MILVVMGVCGCGKTTVSRRLADELGCQFLEGDDLHTPANRAKMSAGEALTDEDRWPWLDRIAAEIRAHDQRGESLAVACSALRRVYRARLEESGAGLLFLHLDGTRDLFAARMTARQDHFMPASLLDSQLATLEAPGPEEPALRLDAGATPESLVRQVRAHLNDSPETARKDRP